MPLTTGVARVDEQERRKRNLLIIAGILVLLTVATVFEVGIRAPQIPVASNLVVFALFNLNLIVFLLLLVLLFRNLVKLSFEHRHNVIGARFKAKLVLTFLALALTPGILIFIIASNFITTSIEGWFKPQVERPLDQAMEVAQTYYQTLESTALRHARYIAGVVEKDGLLARSEADTLAAYLAEQQDRLGVASITVLDGRGEVLHVKNRALPAAVASSEANHEHVRQALGGQEITTVHEQDNGDMIQAVVPVRPGPGQAVDDLLVDRDAQVTGELAVAQEGAFPQLPCEGRIPRYRDIRRQDAGTTAQVGNHRAQSRVIPKRSSEATRQHPIARSFMMLTGMARTAYQGDLVRH